MKVAIYLRTSTAEQHPEKQEQECIELAKAKGYIIAGVYLEQLSAYKQIDRPKYDAIKDMARKGEIQAVIVWA
ncbi:MAG: recombinase family protein, partial [Proteobacteria bacterium]|nr:recombinase family protein [Pseudomonadota bacterium]